MPTFPKKITELIPCEITDVESEPETNDVFLIVDNVTNGLSSGVYELKTLPIRGRTTSESWNNYKKKSWWKLELF